MSTGTTRKKTTNHYRNNTGKNRKQTKKTEKERMISKEVILIFLFAAGVLLFLCNFGVIGPAGDAVSDCMFGLFGLLSYVTPILLFIAVAFGISNQDNTSAMLRLFAAIMIYILLGMVFCLGSGQLNETEQYSLKELYLFGKTNRSGGGIMAGSLTYFFRHYLDLAGTILIMIVLALISIVIITGKSLIQGVRESSRKVYETARDDATYRREKAISTREEQRQSRECVRENGKGSKTTDNVLDEDEQKILRMNKKVTGVMMNTALRPEDIQEQRDDIHEIRIEDTQSAGKVQRTVARSDHSYMPEELEKIRIHTAGREDTAQDALKEEETILPESYDHIQEETAIQTKRQRPVAHTAEKTEVENGDNQMVSSEAGKTRHMPKKYHFPPVSLLSQSKKTGMTDSSRQLKETAVRLQQTLQTFGVKVTVTDISQGPSVTRYELQPETGVKVSKIVGLSDDIKLNLAATDIRIEAPIPGKAAVGIEVPNKENTAVGLRELIESKEFSDYKSKIGFAVGKDISGHVVVADIAKMPHMLIAGATGSGKSVCINTIIMSILYKAHPDDVKLIMIDPKVVELSVYNGIPHLMIPVVTDPKKAAAALHWGVAEMTDRYKKFADLNVRDLKGYNNQIQNMINQNESEIPPKMPQIVIIVDELADLMMVAAQEVEESICRLAQLARAAGIHLIIATQRPSVDVITGLIKANMPSRVAFAVSSGVDSRTILDMNGAEKLLGKGDMLFYPQGYPKPARIQGAFVSDQEVSDVVDFLKNQMLGNTYDESIEDRIKDIGKNTGMQNIASGAGSESEVDSYFEEAGKFIIEKDKASIGMLQRVYKIGFNRAARIMDQLCDAGVVGEEEGTKPRKVLMNLEQFEQYLEEHE